MTGESNRFISRKGKLVFAVYNAVIPAARLAVEAGSLFHKRLGMLVEGRKNLSDRVEEVLGKKGDTPRIWFHSASYGEFEHALAVMEKLKKTLPESVIVTTFFSDSGYKHGDRSNIHDAYFYSPFDTQREVSEFLDALEPDIFVLLPGDIWPNTLRALVARGIPTLLADAYITSGSARSGKAAGRIYPHFYRLFTRIMAVTDADAEAFAKSMGETIGETGTRVVTAGDSRFDRVADIASVALSRSDIPWDYFRPYRVILAGSTLPADEKVILPGCATLLRKHPDTCLMITPHEPEEDAFAGIETWAVKSGLETIRFSEIIENIHRIKSAYPLDERPRIVIVDSVGFLSALYGTAHAAYVGGGFGKGVHSVLEPAVFGIPVIVGGSVSFSRTAQELMKAGGLNLIHSTDEFEELLLSLFENKEKSDVMGRAAADYVESRKGASGKIVKSILELLEKKG